jgi:nucleotide-binding universal stress UspA family protein
MTAKEPITHRIVVGFDGSASSIAALDWAAAQAERTGSSVEVVTAWEWPTVYGAPMAFPEGFDPGTDAQAIADDGKQRITASFPGVTVRTVVEEGHPAPVLVEASEGASLLAVGSRGHGEFVGMLIGSVSEHAVANAHCPVLVFRG